MSISTNSLVSGVPYSYLYNGVWSSKPSATTVPSGAMIWVTDVGANGGSAWVSNGTVWRLANITILKSLPAPVTGLAQIAEQIMYSTSIQRSVLENLRFWYVNFHQTKSGITDTFTSFLRVGTAGTLSDTSVVSSAQPAAANRSFSAGMGMVYDSGGTRVVNYGTASFGGIDTSLVGSAAWPTIAVTVATDVPVFFTMSSSSSGTTDTPTIRGYQIIAG